MQKNKNFMFVNLSKKEDFLHEHEIFEIMHSRKLYQVQIDLRRKLKKRIKALEAEQKVNATQFETKRTLFLQKIADRKRKRPLIKYKTATSTQQTSTNVLDVHSEKEFWVTNDKSVVFQSLNKAISEPALVSSPLSANRSQSSVARSVSHSSSYLETTQLEEDRENYTHGTIRLPPIKAFRDMKSMTSIQFNRAESTHYRAVDAKSASGNREESADSIYKVYQENHRDISDGEGSVASDVPFDSGEIIEDATESVSCQNGTSDKVLRRHQRNLKTAMSLPDLRQVAILPGNQVFVMGKLMNETEYRALLDRFRQARVARIKKVERKYKILEQKIKDFHLDEKHKDPYSKKQDITGLFIQ